jgi:hypothetical protein
MRMTGGWTGLRIAAIAAGLLIGSAPLAQADSIQADNILNYTTSGGPGTAGVTGAAAISFVPVQNESVDTASNISLGTFVVAGLTNGETTTYNNTPFTLSLIPNSFNGTALKDTAVQITGTLSGMVSGSNQSNVTVTFNQPQDPTFAIGTGSGTLHLSNTTELLVPSTTQGGQTTIQAQVVTSGIVSEAPEPSTIALFLSTVCGLGLRRYVQSRRKRNHV